MKFELKNTIVAAVTVTVAHRMTSHQMCFHHVNILSENSIGQPLGGDLSAKYCCWNKTKKKKNLTKNFIEIKTLKFELFGSNKIKKESTFLCT